ncbi:hypothetical protein GCM10010329_46990 [Streptomyces spiroverticillatus]|uniref:Uncharacterized protein n=1 Tax=Streptomyces finlayi TaxID=67296 RepID=A0A919CBC0_9ACTN|nr:hypothetical protein [Streptomyces finlayi]GHA18431.1 hypothetical protein GCM10010329_46990 [Streptomyces spiroverticillatus]GHD00013.1 hypothetical protein GCM10010334_44160 [Streptomyces finlayi]
MKQHREEAMRADLTWRQRTLSAVGFAGCGGGVTVWLVLVLLAGLLLVVAPSGGAVESDGVWPVVWAALVLIPCTAAVSLLMHPLRVLTRTRVSFGRARRVTDALVSTLATFLSVLLTLVLTPGLTVRQPWLPALAATLAVTAANVVAERFGGRKGRA